MKKCKIHKIVLTFRAGKEGELFCKVCDRIKRGIIPIVKEKPKKKWWKFW